MSDPETVRDCKKPCICPKVTGLSFVWAKAPFQAAGLLPAWVRDTHTPGAQIYTRQNFIDVALPGKGCVGPGAGPVAPRWG